MRDIRVITGNIFTSSCQTIVNTVNCAGVMGAGIAYECRLRYPRMFEQYVGLCEGGAIDIGKLWLFKDANRWILNFPTKKHWKFPSREGYLQAGLEKFVLTYAQRGITSIAFPVLGAQNGGLDLERSIAIMQEHLAPCTIPIEIYRHDPLAQDDVYERFKALVRSTSEDGLIQATGLRSHIVRLLKEAIESPDIRQLSQLAGVKGLGSKTLEAAFACMRSGEGLPEQRSLL